MDVVVLNAVVLSAGVWRIHQLCRSSSGDAGLEMTLLRLVVLNTILLKLVKSIEFGVVLLRNVVLSASLLRPRLLCAVLMAHLLWHHLLWERLLMAAVLGVVLMTV